MSTGTHDERHAALRALVGTPLPGAHRPHVEYATSDTVRAFARGYGDDDPRWDAAAVGDHAVAPPLFPLATGSTPAGVVIAPVPLPAWLRARHVSIEEDRWQLGPPVRLGTRLERRDHIAAVAVDDADVARSVESTAGPTAELGAVRVTMRSTYAAAGVVHAVHDRTRRHDVHEPAHEPRVKHRYTDREIDAITGEIERWAARGPGPAGAHDLHAGQLVGPLVKGPLTVTDLVAYRGGVGAGPFDVEPLELALRNRAARPSFYDRTDTNAWDARERLHWDESYAVACGHPTAYDYSHTRLVWASQLCTSWAPAGRLTAITGSLHAHNYVGDTHWLHAVVRDIEGVEVHLDWHAVNQLGATTASGRATMSFTG